MFDFLLSSNAFNIDFELKKITVRRHAADSFNSVGDRDSRWSPIPPVNYFCNGEEANLVSGSLSKIVNSIGYFPCGKIDFCLFEVDVGAQLSFCGPFDAHYKAFGGGPQ